MKASNKWDNIIPQAAVSMADWEFETTTALNKILIATKTKMRMEHGIVSACFINGFIFIPMLLTVVCAMVSSIDWILICLKYLCWVDSLHMLAFSFSFIFFKKDYIFMSWHYL